MPPEDAGEATGTPVSRSERAERALAAIDQSGVGLEIGPSYDPLMPKTSGARVEIVDHLATPELIEKYQELGLTPDKIAAIEEVDHIWSGGRLVDVLGRPGEFDFIIAAHLIEHVVDLIGFLQDCQELLGPNGRLALVVPDQRFCFDFFKPATSVGQVIDAHLNPTQFHSPGTLLEHGLYDCATDGHTAWANGQLGPLALCHTDFDYARSTFDRGVAQEEYVDAHHWKFTPASFSLLIQDLRDLGHHSFVEIASHPTVGFEFYSTLALGEPEEPNRRDRFELLTRARAEQVEVSPTYRELRADTDVATGALADAERVLAHTERVLAHTERLLEMMEQRARQADAHARLVEAQVGELKGSRSWRVTRPMREFTELARRLRRPTPPTGRPTTRTGPSTAPTQVEDPVILPVMVDSLIEQLSTAETLTELPAIVDIAQRTPPNPPAHIQEQFVGSSYEAAYSEAFSFAHVVKQWSTKNGRGALPSLDRILDFGSGWGRITRVLLTQGVHPRNIIAADVDQEMTALVNVSLPGVTALSVDPMPPTLLNDATLDLVTAYSVFSHLSPTAHEAWAKEFGRLVVDGGLVVLTVLDRIFFDQIQSSMMAIAEGNPTPAAESLAGAFPDLAGATAAFDRGKIVYAGTGGAGVRTGDYYGWAAAPKKYIENTWGPAGFDIVEWVPSGVLFQQAAVALRRRVRVVPADSAVPAATFREALRTGARAARNSATKLRHKRLRRN